MKSFTKLFSSITESTVWAEPMATRIVWITMLAMADRLGRIDASVPGLANRARVSIEEAEAALARFLAPDHYSRTPDHEGRRIEVIEGGWQLLNYAKYREMRDEEARREQNREAQRRRRGGRSKTKIDLPAVSKDADSQPRSAQAEAEAEEAKATAADAAGAALPLPGCPHERLIELYHETLPMLPRVLEWTPKRQTHLRQRWREKAKPNGTGSGYRTADEGLHYWREFFGYVRRSRFLTGQAPTGNGRSKPFLASLDWLIKPDNFAKVVEGKYADTEGSLH